MVRSANQTSAGHCVNLSAGGAALELAADLQIGDQIELAVELPGGTTARIRAEVVHAARSLVGLYGVRFLELSQRSLASLHHTLARASQEQPLVEPQFVHL